MSRSGVARVDFYFDDWLTGTFELDPALRGAFITICALVWKTRDRLADNDDAVARWVGVKPRRWREMKSALVAAGKISVEDGFIRQERAAEELAVSEERFQNAQKRGQKGHQKRTHIAPIQNANPLETNETTPACSRATNTNTYKKKEESLTTETPTRPPNEPELPLAPSAPALPVSKPKAQKPAYPPQFEQLWDAYPLRKQDRAAKVDVFNRWKTETKGQDHEAIIAAARAFARANGQDEYRIGLKAWLRNRAWLTAPTPTVASARASPPMDPRLAARLAESKARRSAEAAGLQEYTDDYDRHVAALMIEWNKNEQRRSA